MTTLLRVPKFWRFALGLLSLGIGQRLLLTGVVSPWTQDAPLSIVLLLSSIVFLVIGLFCVFPVGLSYYKKHCSDKRLIKSLMIYFLATLISGFLIGGVGQLLYDHTSFSYLGIKTGIWAVTAIVQNILKIILCFSLVSIYKGLPIIKRKHDLILPLVLGCFISMISLALAFWLPKVGSVLVSMTDILMIIVTLYYFIYLKEGKYHEEIS